MVVTIMEKIFSLTKKLSRDLADRPGLTHLTFKKGEMFSWDHTACAITYNSSLPDASSYLLHEAAHAILGHASYRRDIELIAMERAAWQAAIELAPAYDISIDPELIEDSLDTYRDWLHARSLCPQCSATGIQVRRFDYQCLACHHTWRVNEARSCALRRYGAKKRPQ